MNRIELLEEIRKTKQHLANLEHLLANPELERWKPERNEVYYTVDRYGEVKSTQNIDCLWDRYTINFYNCFQTREQAQEEADKILVRRQLEDIARRLNKGRKIDWFDGTQYKFYITAHFTKYSSQSLELQGIQAIMNEGSVYCLSEDFLDVALSEIGSTKLWKYLMGTSQSTDSKESCGD